MSSYWYNGSWHNAEWYNRQWFRPIELQIDDCVHGHNLQTQVLQYVPSQDVLPFYRWNADSTRKILYSFSFREFQKGVLGVSDILHNHELEDSKFRLEDTVFILDNPDSTELGAGWETVT